MHLAREPCPQYRDTVRKCAARVDWTPTKILTARLIRKSVIYAGHLN